MLSPRKYAEKIGRPYSTVMFWLQNELLPGAVKHKMPSGGHFWEVPANAEPPDLQPGPRPKPKQKK